MKMTRRALLGAAAAMPLGAGRTPRRVSPHRFGDYGRSAAPHLVCTGHPFARTPNLDRVAREGVLKRVLDCLGNYDQ